MNVSHYQAQFVNALGTMIVDGPNARHELGAWVVVEHPSLERTDPMPTEESAQAYALALNQWLDVRPSPDAIAPFFTEPAVLRAARLEEQASEGRLHRILDAAVMPELLAARIAAEHGAQAARIDALERMRLVSR